MATKWYIKKAVPESSEKTSQSDPDEWSEFEKPGTVCYKLAIHRFSLVQGCQANFSLACTPVCLSHGDCNTQKVRDSICHLVCIESGGEWNIVWDWRTWKGSQVPQFVHSHVSTSIDHVHFTHDLIDNVAGIAHSIWNSNGKTHFPIQEGRSLQMSMRGWERPLMYFIKICTVIFPLPGRHNLTPACMCVFLLPAEHLAGMQLCSSDHLGCLRWAQSTPHPIQLSVKPLLKGLYWGETQSLPALRTRFQCCIALLSSVCFSSSNLTPACCISCVCCSLLKNTGHKSIFSSTHGLLAYLFIYTGIFIKCLHPLSGISSVETIRILSIFSNWPHFWVCSLTLWHSGLCCGFLSASFWRRWWE